MYDTFAGEGHGRAGKTVNKMPKTSNRIPSFVDKHKIKSPQDPIRADRLEVECKYISFW